MKVAGKIMDGIPETICRYFITDTYGSAGIINQMHLIR
jgi:hypothetical protein